MPKGRIISFEIEFNFSANVVGCGCWSTFMAAYPSFSIDGYDRLFATDIDTSERINLNYGFIANTNMSLVYRDGILTNNGVQKHTGLSLGAEYNGTFYLFGLNIVNDRQIYANGAKFSRFKVETENDSIDLIPVRIGDVGYMYDQISGNMLGNAGRGSFVLGPDIG